MIISASDKKLLKIVLPLGAFAFVALIGFGMFRLFQKVQVHALMLAAEKGDTKSIERILGYGISPTATERFGKSTQKSPPPERNSLEVAMMNNRADAAVFLLKKGVPFDVTYYPLLVMMHNPKTAFYLIDKGENKLDLFHAAVKHGGAKMVLALGSRYPDIIPQVRAETLFQNALRSESAATIRALVSLGMDVNVKDKGGHTPLMFAIDIKSGMIEALLECGADISIRAESGQTVLDLAIMTGNSEIAEVIRKYGGQGTSKLEPLKVRARTAEDLGEWYEALTVLRQIRKIAPDDIHTLYNLSRLLVSMGEVDEALPIITQVVAREPKYVHAHYVLGSAYQKKNRWNEATSAYQEVVRLSPDYVRAQVRIVECLFGRKKEKEGFALAKQLRDKNPQNFEAIQIYGQALQAGGQYAEAGKEFRRALEIEPNDGTAHSDYGTILIAQKKIDEGLAEKLKACELEPYDPSRYVELGTWLSYFKKHEEAAGAYITAIQLYPKYPKAYQYLGWELIQLKQVDEAVVVCAKACELDPKESDAFANLAKAWMLKGNYANAMQAARKALTLKPQNAEARFYMGEALAKAGQSAEAKKELETYLKMTQGTKVPEEQERIKEAQAFLQQ
jgi:superkiller protein 3